jgi:hypothetical protein
MAAIRITIGNFLVISHSKGHVNIKSTGNVFVVARLPPEANQRINEALEGRDKYNVSAQAYQ